jgi:hypothetical protein
MADTPIDQAANLTSIRLKVPTGTVPVPPPGHLQLHAPDLETLAFRRADGGVVEVGGVVETINDPFHTGGVTISPAGGRAIRLNGPVTDALDQPQAPDAVTLVHRSGAPAQPPAGSSVVWLDPDGLLSKLDGTGDTTLRLVSGGGSVGVGADGSFSATNGAGSSLYADSGGVQVGLPTTYLWASATGLVLALGSGTLRLTGLPTADPHVDGALWIAPLTRQLMVSAG